MDQQDQKVKKVENVTAVMLLGKEANQGKLVHLAFLGQMVGQEYLDEKENGENRVTLVEWVLQGSM